jgi:predicted RNA-binding protein (virulence factor B family)
MDDREYYMILLNLVIKSNGNLHAVIKESPSLIRRLFRMSKYTIIHTNKQYSWTWYTNKNTNAGAFIDSFMYSSSSKYNSVIFQWMMENKINSEK